MVGPNGSGKSNLVDALRWGLGETNARELRGQRMDEVIYAGSGERARVNVASVELVIDNEEGKLPVADPEVSVSRRVVRGEGDTEFRLNGERVRLRDLERVLGGTGLTQNGYAVVVQNDIDGIIESTPAQRRTRRGETPDRKVPHFIGRFRGRQCKRVGFRTCQVPLFGSQGTRPFRPG